MALLVLESLLQPESLDNGGVWIDLQHGPRISVPWVAKSESLQSLNEFFAFEVGYADLGKVVTQYSTSISPNDIDAILDDTYSVHPYQGDGWFGAVVLKWPVNPDVITLHVRTGAFSWKSDLDVRVISGGTGSVNGSKSGTDFMYGFGLEWHIDPAWSLVAEWERYELNEWLDVPSIGVKMSF